MTGNALQFGSLGSVALLPQNPLWNYVEMTFWRANFLLLMPLYLVALFLMALWRKPGAGLYLLMGFGIASIHFVIFGLSTYSHLVQIGTTANRILTANAARLHCHNQCRSTAHAGSSRS